MSALRFHQPTLDSFGKQANQSAAHIFGLRRLEEEVGRKLPASLFEWYSLEDCIDMLKSGTGKEHRYPSPAEDAFWKMEAELAYPRTSAGEATWCLFRPGDVRGRKKKEAYAAEFDLECEPKVCLCVVIDSGGSVRLLTVFDGTQDPPVYHDNDSENVDEWLIVADSFSQFVFKWVKECNR